MLNYARIYSLFFFSDVTLRVDSFLACFLYFVIPCCERCIPKCLKFLHLNVRATAVYRILTLSSLKKNWLFSLFTNTGKFHWRSKARGKGEVLIGCPTWRNKQSRLGHRWIHGHCSKTRIVDGIAVSDAAKGCIAPSAISKRWRTQISISCFYMYVVGRCVWNSPIATPLYSSIFGWRKCRML